MIWIYDWNFTQMQGKIKFEINPNCNKIILNIYLQKFP